MDPIPPAYAGLAGAGLGLYFSYLSRSEEIPENVTYAVAFGSIAYLAAQVADCYWNKPADCPTDGSSQDSRCDDLMTCAVEQTAIDIITPLFGKKVAGYVGSVDPSIAVGVLSVLYSLAYSILIGGTEQLEDDLPNALIAGIGAWFLYNVLSCFVNPDPVADNAPAPGAVTCALNRAGTSIFGAGSDANSMLLFAVGFGGALLYNLEEGEGFTVGDILGAALAGGLFIVGYYAYLCFTTAPVGCSTIICTMKMTSCSLMNSVLTVLDAIPLVSWFAKPTPCLTSNMCSSS